ncbi:MAG: hypothetical protein MZU97_20435 [Bacillus subtilis]|nr:hypothetical protein [Bacillus subtilis]
MIDSQPKPIRIAYIGGGSRLWARSLMSDLALEETLEGAIVLATTLISKPPSATSNLVIA